MTPRRPPHMRRLMIGLYLCSASLLLAHSINAFVEDELAAIPSITPVSSLSSEVTGTPSLVAADFIEHIQASGLFAMPTIPTTRPSAPPGGDFAKPTKPPLNVAQKIRLLGTVLDDRGGGFAVTEEMATKQQRLVRLHDTIDEIGEVSAIRRDAIVIRQDDQEELLALALVPEDQPPGPVLVSPASPAPSSRRTLDRREVAAAVNDPTKLMMQAHAVPFLQNGLLQGFRLDFVNPGGFFDQAGFQYGDVIQRINGVDIQDPGRLLGMFREVVNERTVKVDIVRAGRKATLTYELR